MTLDQILEIVTNIRYKNWAIEVYAMPEYTLRVAWFDTDVNTGKKELQISREYFLDPKDLSEENIVNTVFKCIQNAEEHEIKERFMYKGRRIFDPHRSLASLMKACDDKL